MKEIELTQGKIAIVDDEDYDDLIKYKWQVSYMRNCIYAKRGTWENKKVRNVSMQAHILGLLKPFGRKFQIDHKNGDGLDNRRENIRVSTYSQNQANRKRNSGKTSKYKGVDYCENRKKYRTRIKLNYTEIQIGEFNNEIEAAKAYDKKAIELFGEFASLNFPE